jgi:hypothetical protein
MMAMAVAMLLLYRCFEGILGTEIGGSFQFLYVLRYREHANTPLRFN